jgi:beta-phosphoglucomutase family hydrolase
MAARALIWDLDGVIADTAPFHLRAWQRVAEDRGITFSETDFSETFGRRNPEIIAAKFGDVPPGEADDIASTKEEVFRRIAKQSIKAFPGVLSLLLSVRSAGWSTAIASSTPPENIDLTLDSLGISGLLDAVVSSADVSRGKPDPEGFLLAAERLGVAPDDCVVIEDAVAGVQSARSAGMRCVAVTNTHPAARLAEADLVVETLEGITLEAVESLLRR